ncbi:hypothetical protein G6F56_001453 [Rhizopus delemar]|nr:hypothetical protein G6F56_001453 [Rhizopus delemar]
MNANAPSFVPTTDSNNNNRRRRQPKKNRPSHENTTESNDVVQRSSGCIDKKGRVSLNHLLSFSLPERQQSQPAFRKQKTTSYQPFNKEKFINAK